MSIRERIIQSLNENENKSYDILYSVKGDKHIGRHLKTVDSEKKALDHVRKLSNLPKDTIHYAVTCDDGRVIHDSSKHGLASGTKL